jgi:glutamate racemase
MAPRTDRKPIGVMDSGVGGLSVLQAVRDALPAENLLYVADSRHAPYGERSKEFVSARAHALLDFLSSRGAKAIVVACNTATEMAIESLRSASPLPIIGVEPAINVAAARTKSGVVGVLATRGTVNGHRVARLVRQHEEHEVRVVTRACPELVDCVEAGAVADESTRRLVRLSVEPMLSEGADAIVLGCTHFHFLRSVVQDVAGPSIAVVDSAAAVARQLERRMTELNLRTPRTTPGAEEFWTSGAPGDVVRVFRTLWPADGVVVHQLPREFADFDHTTQCS